MFQITHSFRFLIFPFPCNEIGIWLVKGWNSSEFLIQSIEKYPISAFVLLDSVKYVQGVSEPRATAVFRVCCLLFTTQFSNQN